MSIDPNAEFDHTVLDMIESNPIGALPVTPAYQDALLRLYAARQVYAHADYKGGHVTARYLLSLPSFHANNIADFISGSISEDQLEANSSIYDRYVASLNPESRDRAEAMRLMVIGKPSHHRTKHGQDMVHDPMHTLFLVPGAGPHPGLPGNYLHGAVFHIGDETMGSWVVHVHDSDDGASVHNSPTLPEALSKLEEVLASAPFHLKELDELGFQMT